MITKFSVFEAINYTNIYKLKVGDYVIMNSYSENDVLINFLENNIGKIMIVNYDRIVVKYENIPEDCKFFFSLIIDNIMNNGDLKEFHIKLIKHISDNKEDLGVILSQNKYNL